MAIQQKIRILQRAEAIVTELKANLASRNAATHDLNKLSESLKKIIVSLEKLDQLKPHQNTSEIDALMRPVNLDIALLKGELPPADFNKLDKAIKAVKATLKFHPAKTSVWESVVLWFYELIYFI